MKKNKNDKKVSCKVEKDKHITFFLALVLFVLSMIVFVLFFFLDSAGIV